MNSHSFFLVSTYNEMDAGCQEKSSIGVTRKYRILKKKVLRMVQSE